jgi:hypothetical protein
VTAGSKKSERANTAGNFQYFVVGGIGESFQNEIFEAKHVPRVRGGISARLDSAEYGASRMPMCAAFTKADSNENRGLGARAGRGVNVLPSKN